MIIGGIGSLKQARKLHHYARDIDINGDWKTIEKIIKIAREEIKESSE
jgi:hypothetical protein